MRELNEEEIIDMLIEIKNHQVAFFEPKEHKQILKNYFTQEQRDAIQGLLDLYQAEKEKNKLTGNDIENFKAQAYMLGRKDENEAMKGVIERHYISKDKINSKIGEYEDILQSSIIKEDYKLEVEHIIRVLEELKGE